MNLRKGIGNQELPDRGGEGVKVSKGISKQDPGLGCWGGGGVQRKRKKKSEATTFFVFLSWTPPPPPRPPRDKRPGDCQSFEGPPPPLHMAALHSIGSTIHYLPTSNYFQVPSTWRIGGGR